MSSCFPGAILPAHTTVIQGLKVGGRATSRSLTPVGSQIYGEGRRSVDERAQMGIFRCFVTPVSQIHVPVAHALEQMLTVQG